MPSKAAIRGSASVRSTSSAAGSQVMIPAARWPPRRELRQIADRDNHTVAAIARAYLTRPGQAITWTSSP